MQQCIRTGLGLQAALVAANCLAFEPPLGIPAPPFGINESVDIYVGNTAYLDAGNGPYTHYVDNTAANCSDVGAANSLEPLCNLPESLSAGDVVEVHGGPYTQNDIEITANGTLAQPVFIRGINDGSGNPSIEDGDEIILLGTYFVFEDFELDRTRLKIGDSGQEAFYAAARNVRVHDHPDKNGSSLTGDYLLLWSNEIDHNQGNDRHGTFISSESQNVWILDNYYHHNGGDAIQFCHGCTTVSPNTIFIGRNTMHSDRENAVDLKYAENIVISQNTMYGYAESPKDELWCFDDGSACDIYSSGSDGSAIVVGSDGDAKNVWVIANNIYNSNHGIRVEKSFSTLNIVGNVIRDINSMAILFEKLGKPVNIILNTFYNVERGISQDFRKSFDPVVKDNIFLQSHDSAIYFDDEEVAYGAVLDNNLFWNDGGVVEFRWKNSKTITTSAEINELAGNCKLDNILADPQLVDPMMGSFSPSATSGAIDAASNSLITFDQVYRDTIPGGTSILKDIDGNPRTVGSIEIGALEYVASP